MPLDPQLNTSGGGLYPASDQSQPYVPIGNNKIEPVPALKPVREVAAQTKQGEGLSSYDDLSQISGVMNGATLPTGETWGLTGAGQSSTVVTRGQMIAVANTYAYFIPGASFSRIDGAFSFRRRGSGTNDPNATDLTLIVDNAYQTLGTILHLRLSPQAWILDKFVNGVQTLAVASGNFVAVEGGVYGIGMERLTATTVRIYLPDGSTRDVTDADFALMTWRYPCWQIAATANSWEGRWSGMSIGQQTQGGINSMSGAANAAAVAWLIGAGMSRRRRAVLTLSGAAGWFRIANTDVLYTFQMAGRVQFGAFDGVRSQLAELDVKAFFNSVSPILTERFSHRYNGGPITQVRLSTDSAGFGIFLDVNKANAADATIELDYFGLFVPNLNPVTGAAVGPTGAATVTLT